MTVYIIYLLLLFVPIVLIFFLVRVFKVVAGGKCEICGISSRDVYFDSSVTKHIYCRNHLMEVFRKDFTSFTHKVVLCHPKFDISEFKVHFPYFIKEDMQTFNLLPIDESKTLALLEEIQGICVKCSSNASVLYFPNGVLIYHHFEPLVRDLVFNQGMLLCKLCALREIDAPIANNTSNYVYGLYAPYREDGLYVSLLPLSGIID